MIRNKIVYTNLVLKESQFFEIKNKQKSVKVSKFRRKVVDITKMAFASTSYAKNMFQEPKGKKFSPDSLEHSMARTLEPKYASYFGDGSGRDSYIILNNGGLAVADKSGMMRRTMRVQPDLTKKAYKESTAVKYISDGSGRDSYVIRNSGGLVSDFRGSKPEVHFKSTLRAPIQVQTKHVNSNGSLDLEDYQNWISPTDKFN